MGIWKKMSLYQRLLLANVVYAVPFLFILFQLASTVGAQIEFADLEHKGVQYQTSIESVLSAVLNHKMEVGHYAAGLRPNPDHLRTLAANVDNSFASLKRIDEELGTALQFTDAGLAKRSRSHLKFAAISNRWEKLKNATNLRPEEALAESDHLIADLRGAVTHVGDTSNLILDPDLDSYYLMDVVVVAMPEIQEQLQKMVVIAEPILRRGVMTPEEKNLLVQNQTILNSVDLPHVETSTQTSLNEDANFGGTSPTLQGAVTPAVAKFLDIAKRFDGMVNTLVAQGPKAVNPDEFVKVGQEAVSNSFEYWTVASKELDKLLEIRTSDLQHAHTRDIATGIIALIVSSGLLLLITRNFTKNIRKIMDSLRASVSSTSKAGSDLVGMSRSLSNASSDQASAIQETVATLNEINAMVSKTLQNTNQSSESAEQSETAAKEGKSSVDQMKNAIAEINESNSNIMKEVEESNRKISEIIHVINEIGSKTKVINDIVFQTKLLSFNASVEAARAGEHGKGFAVVAEEVGNLAQMSGNAAQEIGDMLADSIKKVNSIVDDTKSKVDRLITSGRGKVEAGTHVAHQCGDALEEIVGSVVRLRGMISEITSAADEQAKGVNEITHAMHQLESTTNQTSSMSNETASFSSRVSDNANSLSRIVEGIEAEVFGQKGFSPMANARMSDESMTQQFTRAEQEWAAQPTQSASVQLKQITQPAKMRAHPPVPAKKMEFDRAVGASQVPAENDPRFEDL